MLHHHILIIAIILSHKSIFNYLLKVALEPSQFVFFVNYEDFTFTFFNFCDIIHKKDSILSVGGECMSHDFKKENRVEMKDYDQTGIDIYASSMILYDSFPPHWHDHYEFEYCIKGTGCQVINGTSFPIGAGTLCVFSPTDFHEIIVEEPMEMLKIAYQESDIDPFISSLFVGFPTGSPILLDEKNNTLFVQLFNSIIQTMEMYNDSPYGKATAQKLVESVILNTINWFGKNNTENESSSQMHSSDIHGILVFIHKNFNKQITLKKVAENSHFSPHYLSKLFHQKMGIPFKEYVTNLQMNYASKLMLNTDKSITDICYESGFGSLSNFTREFKKFYTLSPSEYKRKNISAKKETMKTPLNLRVEFLNKESIAELKNKNK